MINENNYCKIQNKNRIIEISLCQYIYIYIDWLIKVKKEKRRKRNLFVTDKTWIYGSVDKTATKHEIIDRKKRRERKNIYGEILVAYGTPGRTVFHRFIVADKVFIRFEIRDSIFRKKIE